MKEINHQAIKDRLVKRAVSLYQGTRVHERSASVAIAETFSKRVTPYHGIVRGGYNKDGECSAIIAGRLIIAEFLADSNPRAVQREQLEQACKQYQAECSKRIQGQGSTDFFCSSLTAPFEDFHGLKRLHFCSDIIAEVVSILYEILHEHITLEEST